MSGDDYTRRQTAKDAEYQREYRAWIDSLPADERRKLEAQGLAAPDVAHHGNGSAKGDAADSPLMRDGDDPALLQEPEPDLRCAPNDATKHLPEIVCRKRELRSSNGIRAMVTPRNRLEP